MNDNKQVLTSFKLEILPKTNRASHVSSYYYGTSQSCMKPLASSFWRTSKLLKLLKNDPNYTEDIKWHPEKNVKVSILRGPPLTTQFCCMKSNFHNHIFETQPWQSREQGMESTLKRWAIFHRSLFFHDSSPSFIFSILSNTRPYKSLKGNSKIKINEYLTQVWLVGIQILCSAHSSMHRRLH